MAMAAVSGPLIRGLRQNRWAGLMDGCVAGRRRRRDDERQDGFLEDGDGNRRHSSAEAEKKKTGEQRGE